MNEIEILRQQLATERQHFREVAGACAAALGEATFTSNGAFALACTDYFAFALTRLGSDPARQTLTLLEAARSGDAASAAPRWREFLRSFDVEMRRRFDALDALIARDPMVTEWRAAAGIDADAIFVERTRYSRVKATTPA